MALNVYDDYGLLTEEEVELTKQVFDCVADLMGQKDVCAEYTVVLPDEIREINAATRDVDRVTDVLSFPTLDGVEFPVDVKDFPCDVDPDTGLLILGEIMLCAARMREQAKEYGHSDKRELAYLTAHGCLHLFGFDHMTDGDKAVMREREEAAMKILNISRDLT